MTEQVQIAAGDHRVAPLDKADNGVAERRCLPGFGGDTVVAIDRDGDFAIACTM